MLKITIPGTEFFDESTETFIPIKETTLTLEHSLVSLSKWEAKWNRPFLSKQAMSVEETIDYVRCMTITQNVDPNVYLGITNDNIREVSKYIESPMTATTFYEDNSKAGSKEIVTSELIYYWMIALNIPVEFQKWHLNRLLTLIKVCNIKNNPPKKRSPREIMEQNRRLNAERRAAMNSQG